MSESIDNLNRIELEHHNTDFEYQRPVFKSVKPQSVTVHFDNLVHHVCRYIEQADVVIGCIAWLTNVQILETLTGVECQIIVQKEDFLRPDIGYNTSSKKPKLQALYNQLYNRFDRYDLFGIAPRLSYNGDPSVDPVRCAGVYSNRQGKIAARMHHKFIVFCKHDEHQEIFHNYHLFETHIIPYAVWTGSFNFTHNAERSLENAVYFEGRDIALAYAIEHGHILGLSEPLDWTSEWVEPEYRIGT